MDLWWKNESENNAINPETRAVAYYRHSARDRQENSIPIQQQQVRDFAVKENIEIIKEFADHGFSGLTVKNRPAFVEMMEEWIKKRADFKYVICLNVSRWGRFQEHDYFNMLSLECKRHGKKLVYVKHGMPKSSDLGYQICLQVDQYASGEYSRNLSTLVFNGCCFIARHGYWVGGKAPYGFHRLLLNEQGQPVQYLAPGERKSIQNQRVVLAPGNENEVKTVQRIYHMFVNKRKTTTQIAKQLESEGYAITNKQQWCPSTVHAILTNELYAGTMVYNKTSSKLKSPTTLNPPEQWIKTPDAFEKIISSDLFLKAQGIISEHKNRYLPAEMTRRLRYVFDTYGFLWRGLLGSKHNTASPATYAKRFASLDVAYQNIFTDIWKTTSSRVLDEIRGWGQTVEEYEDFWVLDNRCTLQIQPSVPLQQGYDWYWYFRPDCRPCIDITLGIPVSAEQPHDILGYLMFPRLLTSGKGFRITSATDSRLAMHGHSNLDYIKQLIER